MSIFKGRTLMMNLMYLPRIVAAIVMFLPVLLVVTVAIFILSNLFDDEPMTAKGAIDLPKSLLVIVLTNKWEGLQ